MSGSPPPPYYPPIPEPPKVDPNITVANSGFPPPPQFPSNYQPNVSPVPNAPPPPNGAPAVRHVRAVTATFGPYPVEMDCPYCRVSSAVHSWYLQCGMFQNHIVTHTKRTPGALPWIIFGVCVVLGFFLLIPWCLCCIPFCIDSCLDVEHFCPSCKRNVGL